MDISTHSTASPPDKYAPPKTPPRTYIGYPFHQKSPGGTTTEKLAGKVLFTPTSQDYSIKKGKGMGSVYLVTITSPLTESKTVSPNAFRKKKDSKACKRVLFTSKEKSKDEATILKDVATIRDKLSKDPRVKNAKAFYVGATTQKKSKNRTHQHTNNAGNNEPSMFYDELRDAAKKGASIHGLLLAEVPTEQLGAYEEESRKSFTEKLTDATPLNSKKCGAGVGGGHLDSEEDETTEDVDFTKDYLYKFTCKTPEKSKTEEKEGSFYFSPYSGNNKNGKGNGVVYALAAISPEKFKHGSPIKKRKRRDFEDNSEDSVAKKVDELFRENTRLSGAAAIYIGATSQPCRNRGNQHKRNIANGLDRKVYNRLRELVRVDGKMISCVAIGEAKKTELGVCEETVRKKVSKRESIEILNDRKCGAGAGGSSTI